VTVAMVMRSVTPAKVVDVDVVMLADDRAGFGKVDDAVGDDVCWYAGHFVGLVAAYHLTVTVDHGVFVFTHVIGFDELVSVIDKGVLHGEVDTHGLLDGVVVGHVELIPLMWPGGDVGFKLSNLLCCHDDLLEAD